MKEKFRIDKIRLSFLILIILMLLSFQTFTCNSNTISYVKVDSNIQNFIAFMPLRVACVFAEGGIEDLGFNNMIYSGIQRGVSEGLCTLNYSVPEFGPTYFNQYEGFLRDYVSSATYDLIVTVGYDVGHIVEEVAAEYPNQRMILLDAVVDNSNVTSIVFKQNEGAFLVGALAGLMTQTGKLGFIGGMDVPIIHEFRVGYTSGIYYTRIGSETEIFDNIVGSFVDQDTAKSMAESMWESGVDIIFAAAGESGLGVLESVNEQGEGFYAIGVDADQDYLYPGRVLCSMVKRLDVATYSVIKELCNGDWSGGSRSFGLAEDGVGISQLTYTYSLIGSEKIDEVNVTLRNAIINDEIQVPSDESELVQWMDELGILTESTTGESIIRIETIVIVVEVVAIFLLIGVYLKMITH